MKKQIAAFLLASLCFALIAHGQSLVKADQGRPGNQGPWPVAMGGSAQDGGAVVVQDAPCASPVESYIAFDGGGASAVPAAGPLAGRRTIIICSSQRNSGSPIWTIRNDNTAPTTAISSPGQTLGVGDCISYAMGASTTINAISDTSSSVLTITECK